ncbi:MAG TPA: phosphopantetheine-binding protein [Gemmatimonas sp.]|uniref:phosphopantetheine-binding protein n=1 Tax=Gemmatimonas sp. TaxID=1962908 RepID=UPI002EDB5700
MSALTFDGMRESVAAILKEDVSQIGDEDNLVDWGLDSIRLMALTLQWQRAGYKIEFAQLAERPQLTYWWGLLAAAGGEGHVG